MNSFAFICAVKPPVIVEEPEDVAVMHGAKDVIISVKARGSNLSYHWWIKKLSLNKPHKLKKDTSCL